MKNTTTFKIYTEFIAIKNLLTKYNLKIIENDLVLQIDFKGLDDIQILHKLCHLEYFEVSINYETPEFTIEKLKNKQLNYTVDDLEEEPCRINYNKDINNSYVKNLDYYFFSHEEAIKFLTLHPFTETNHKINFGIYDINTFETPTFRFIDLLNESEYSNNKIIEENVLTKIQRLLTNTDQKFNLYNNVFSYRIDSEANYSDFQRKIIREFYKAFFKLLSYKEDNGIYDIRGKKNIIITEDPDFTIINFGEFASLTDFLFGDDKFLEKYIIVKNVFTRYVYDRENFTSLDLKIIEINKTTKYYFEKYVQEDLEDFFKNRDTVFKEAINVSKSINEQNDKINSYINVSLISFLILAISFVFKGVSNLNISNLIIANVALITFSLSFYYYLSKSSKERYLTIKSQFLLFLDKMGIILTAEKDELINNYLKLPNEDLKSSLYRIFMLLLFSNVILWTVTIITIIYN